MTLHLHSIEDFEEDEFSGPKVFDSGSYFDLPLLRSPAAAVAWLVVIAAIAVALISLR